MANTINKSVAFTDETIMRNIYVVRGKNVMIDRDLAAL